MSEDNHNGVMKTPRGTISNWIPVVQKTTVEQDDLPFATAVKERTVRTTRTWYINKDYPDVLKLLDKVPET